MTKNILFILCALLIGVGSFSFTANAHDHAGSYGDKSKDEKMVKKNIVETAISNDQFSTLVTALQSADLVEALQGDGPFTVFAPTNDAFAALPEGTLEALLKDENKQNLQAILTYHVVSGKIKAEDIASGSTEVNTLLGRSLTVQKNPDGVTVNGANVTTADIKASNGVIHVIDAVVVPE